MVLVDDGRQQDSGEARGITGNHWEDVKRPLRFTLDSSVHLHLFTYLIRWRCLALAHGHCNFVSNRPIIIYVVAIPKSLIVISRQQATA